jgi:hypothetical protein
MRIISTKGFERANGVFDARTPQSTVTREYFMTAKMDAFESGLLRYCSKRNLKSGRWRAVPRAQVLEIGAPLNLFIYTKDSALRVGWWGVAFNVFNKLCASGREWRLIVLVRGGEDGYVLTGTQVRGMVTGLSKNATEYILHETDAGVGSYFKTFDDLYQHVLT